MNSMSGARVIGEGRLNERMGIIFCAFYANRRAAYLRVDVFNIAERMMNLLNKILCWME